MAHFTCAHNERYYPFGKGGKDAFRALYTSFYAPASSSSCTTPPTSRKFSLREFARIGQANTASAYEDNDDEDDDGNGVGGSNRDMLKLIDRVAYHTLPLLYSAAIDENTHNDADGDAEVERRHQHQVAQEQLWQKSLEQITTDILCSIAKREFRCSAVMMIFVYSAQICA